jgi:hypothetical protein
MTEKTLCSAKVLNAKTGEYQPCAQYGRYNTDVEGVDHPEKRFCHAHSLAGKFARNRRREKVSKAWEEKLARLNKIRDREIRSFELLQDVPDEKLFDDKFKRAISIATKIVEQEKL